MIKFIKLFATAVLFLSILVSCKKENTNVIEELKVINLQVSIQTGKTYNLDLSSYSNVNDMIVLAKQAITFDASEIVKTEMKNMYTFRRNNNQKAGASKEVVVIKIYEPKNGAHCEKTEIIIHFSII
jgi:hypothetical protein